MNNKEVAITQQLNKETKQLENTRRFIQTYKNDMVEQEVQYSWDKDEKNGIKIMSKFISIMKIRS